MSEPSSTTQKTVDPGLFSLSQIMHLMRVEFSRAQRYKYELHCMSISVDRLTSLRDLYGYESKETILEQVVTLMQAQTRSCDFLGRLADDRLLLIVPHTGGEGTEALAGRLLTAVRGLQFDGEGKSIQISLSIGSAHNSGGRTLFFDAMLQAAEAAMEEAHAGGGDRHVTRDPSVPVD